MNVNFFRAICHSVPHFLGFLIMRCLIFYRRGGGQSFRGRGGSSQGGRGQGRGDRGISRGHRGGSQGRGRGGSDLGSSQPQQSKLTLSFMNIHAKLHQC